MATVTFENAPYGSLRVEKLSDTGDRLEGVTIQIKHIETGTTYTQKTEAGGAAVFTDLKPGAYEVREISGMLPHQRRSADSSSSLTVPFSTPCLRMPLPKSPLSTTESIQWTFNGRF